MDIYNEIQLDFVPSNVKKVLSWGINPDSSPHSHQAIAGWCERFWNTYCDIDAPEEIDAVMPLLSDVETHWDIFVATNENSRQMPVEWFQQWLSQINL